MTEDKRQLTAGELIGRLAELRMHDNLVWVETGAVCPYVVDVQPDDNREGVHILVEGIERSPGVDLIERERLRQLDKGYTAECDADRNPDGQLGCAAAALAVDPAIRIGVLGNTWPWPVDTWPGDGPNGPGISRKEELVRAGALIAAELDRLLAAEGGAPGE